jgi:hypothetical protein
MFSHSWAMILPSGLFSVAGIIEEFRPMTAFLTQILYIIISNAGIILLISRILFYDIFYPLYLQ